MSQKKASDNGVTQNTHDSDSPSAAKAKVHEINRANIRVIVDTTYMKPSGDHGSPMMSRVGRQTATETLEFHGEPMVQCESSFAQKRREQAVAEARNEEEEDDGINTKDFQVSMRVQGQGPAS